MSILTIHLIENSIFDKLFPFYQRELLIGNMPPEDYAAVYDRHQLSNGKHQLYGEYDSIFPCVDNIEVTNLERKKIGLSPLRINNCR
jgi:hypothetical protein